LVVLDSEGRRRMADFVGALVDMGFARDRAEKAVNATDGRGVEPAMEWLFANEPAVTEKDANVTSSAPTPAPGGETPAGTATASADGNPAPTVDTTVRSYKCDDCGKILKNDEEMEFHAAKTKHTRFSESNEEKKPLTAEEKAEQLKRIDEKLKIKRAEREEREKQEALQREKFRMKTGREVGEAKRRFEEQEMKEIAEARRREKVEDKQARERVRAQIEADKEARRLKAAAEQAAKDGLATPPVSTPSSVPTSSTNVANSGTSSGESSPPVKKTYTTTKLQIRLPSGKALVQSFGVNEPLAAVRLYVELNRDDGLTAPFNLMTAHPRKTFEADDYEIPLEAHGLVPSGVLMVTKSI
jgi:hypothetical protein